MSKALKNVTSKTSQFQQRIPLLQEDFATRLLCFTLLMILDFGGLVGLVGLVPGPPSWDGAIVVDIVLPLAIMVSLIFVAFLTVWRITVEHCNTLQSNGDHKMDQYLRRPKCMSTHHDLLRLVSVTTQQMLILRSKAVFLIQCLAVPHMVPTYCRKSLDCTTF